jgi:hypothetical protein
MFQVPRFMIKVLTAIRNGGQKIHVDLTLTPGTWNLGLGTSLCESLLENFVAEI